MTGQAGQTCTGSSLKGAFLSAVRRFWISAGPLWGLGQSRYAITCNKEVLLAARNTHTDLLINSTTGSVIESWATIHSIRCLSSGVPIVVASTHQSGPTIIQISPEQEIISHPKSHGLSNEYSPEPWNFSHVPFNGWGRSIVLSSTHPLTPTMSV